MASEDEIRAALRVAELEGALKGLMGFAQSYLEWFRSPVEIELNDTDLSLIAEAALRRAAAALPPADGAGE